MGKLVVEVRRMMTGAAGAAGIDRSPEGATGNHRRVHVIVLGVGLTTVAVTAGLAIESPQPWEVEVFRALNSLDHSVERALWPLQQFGMAIAIPTGAVVLGWLAASWRLPLTMMVLAVSLGWGAANIMREMVGRGRPASILDDVQLGYDVPIAGNAFPSGHAMVVMTLVIVFAPYVNDRLTLTMLIVATIVMLMRIYSGAHMPLDIIGGAAFGTAIGATINLVGETIEPHRVGTRVNSHG